MYKKKSLIILSNSFRPFFILCGLWAFFSIPIWLLNYFNIFNNLENISAILWHQHEMFFGFISAAMTGFILTALPNWTGKLPKNGWRLLLLIFLWITGRIAFLSSNIINNIFMAILDLPFLTILLFFISREVFASKNWKNFPIIILFFLFTIANWIFHIELIQHNLYPTISIKLAICILILLIAILGGRIIPSFTINWLKNQNNKALPIIKDKFDNLAIIILIIFLLFYMFYPNYILTPYFSIIAGFLHFFRLLNWKSWTVTSEPLVWILHLGYAWLVMALILFGLSMLWNMIPSTVSIHAFTTGAFTTMIIAVMTRASLGHTGNKLKASSGTTVIYVAISIAAILRTIEPLLYNNNIILINLAGIFWSIAFGSFLFFYSPMLLFKK